MTWDEILVGVVTVLYLGTAGVHGYHGRWGFALMFVGYTVANIGIIWAARAAR